MTDFLRKSGQLITAPLELTKARRSRAAAEALVRRAPMGFLWNQLYQLWLYGSGLLLNLVVARGVSPAQNGIYAIVLTTFNTATYLAAFGLEEAATIWVPRALTEKGREQSSSFIRRLLFIRLLFLLMVCAGILFLLPVLPGWLNLLGWPLTHGIAGVLGDPALQAHLLPLAFYVLGGGLVNLLFSIFTSLLRTRVTLTISGLSQAGNLGLALLFLWLGWKVDGIFYALGIVSWVTALAYLLWLAPLLFVKRPHPPISLRPAWRLSVAAWLTNLANGALLKQVIIWLLSFYAFSYAQIGFFNLAFQLGHSAGILLVAGLSGVGMATMAAAYTGENRLWLAISWRAVLKVQTLLALPLLVFSLLNAQAIVQLLYGSKYADVAPLLQVFLGFTILTRLGGGGAHQAVLYVLGKQRVVVYLQWAALTLTAVLGFVLIPFFGPMGALVAAGLPPLLVELAQLAVLWPVLPRRYPLRFSARCALAMSVPVVSGILWHPTGALGLLASGLLFTTLLVGSLLVIKPLEADDAGLIGKVKGPLRAVLLRLTRKSARAAAEATPRANASKM